MHACDPEMPHGVLIADVHGHNFWVTASSAAPEFKPPHDNAYVVRDVVSVPAGGFVKIVFVADNPGVWPIHVRARAHKTRGRV